MQALSIGLALSLALAPLAPTASVSAASVALSEPPSTTREGAEIPYGPEPEVGVIEIVPTEPPPEPEPEPEPEPPPPKVEEPVAEPEAPPPPPPKVKDRLGCDGSKPCQKMTVAGIVVGVLGIGAVATGTALLINKDEVVPETPALVRSTQPAGLVATTIGAGVTVTAVLMLVAAHQGYKRDADTRARVRLGPGGLQF